MKQWLTSQHRQKLDRLADLVLPGYGDQPAAAETAMSATGVDRVMKSRPDLQPGLIRLLESIDEVSESCLEELAEADFSLLMTVLCAAYLSQPKVRQALDYPGQLALTPNRGGFGAEELVIEMMQQPKRYRSID